MEVSRRGIYFALRKSNIVIKVPINSLRDSFTTYLLEQGEDLRFIQKLLGYKSTKPTEIYTHNTQKGMGEILSPLNNIDIEDEKKVRDKYKIPFITNLFW